MIFDNLVQQMVQLKASDLYLKSDAKPMARVDGLLQPLTATPLGHVELEQVTKTILSPAQWEDFVHTRECNLSYKSATGDRFRLNAYFQMGALGVVMRKVSNEIPTMESLGLPLKLKEVALKKRGLFFVCGPTGSGMDAQS